MADHMHSSLASKGHVFHKQLLHYRQWDTLPPYYNYSLMYCIFIIEHLFEVGLMQEESLIWLSLITA